MVNFSKMMTMELGIDFWKQKTVTRTQNGGKGAVLPQEYSFFAKNLITESTSTK